jgi:hypothetical protein
MSQGQLLFDCLEGPVLNIVVFKFEDNPFINDKLEQLSAN